PAAPAGSAPPPIPAEDKPSTPAAPVAPTRADDRAALDSLDTCAQAFARLCPRAPANASPVGFRTDSALAGAERRFLTALQFDVASPVSATAAVACKSRLDLVSASGRRATAGGGSILSQACDGLTWPAVVATPPVTTTPPATLGATSTPAIRPTTPTVAATVDLRALDDCAARLARLCPAPQPATGFAVDGRLSRQETTLVAAVAPNAATDADRLKSCTAAATSLQQQSPERRAAGSFGQACRSAQPLTLNPAVLKAIQPRTAVVVPQPQQPVPPR
ncbi:MAG: hypothetical protein FD124_1860, partial [Alphaproteobacteria bacterium]